jgi:DNA invertase Pin-like site-specific DNA recombinase
MNRIYLRVSSKRQDTKSQEPDIQRWAKAHPKHTVYRDKFTERTMNRPGWNRLMGECRSGDTVVVWRLDRLGRTASGLTKLFDELRERKINLVSLKDGLDLSTAAGRMMANILASVAQYDNEVRAERILAGQAVARASGKRWGGSEKGRRLKVTDEQLRVITRMRGEGDGPTAIARATGLTRQTVYTYI